MTQHGSRFLAVRVSGQSDRATWWLAVSDTPPRFAGVGGVGPPLSVCRSKMGLASGS